MILPLNLTSRSEQVTRFRGFMSLVHKPAWRRLVKSLAILITLTFVLPFLTWAFDQGTFNAQANTVMFNREPVKIPANLGLVTEKFQGNDRLVVYIQDLHCNLEVQKNIAGVIHYLVKRHQLNLVGVEGAEGAIDVSKLASFPVRPVREKVGRYFIKEGKMSGAEYYAAIHDPKLALEGIETLADYQANRECVKQFLNEESQGLAYDLKEEMDGLKDTIYSPVLQAHDRHRSDFMEGQKPLLDYAGALVKALVAHRRSLANYPALQSYVSKRLNVFPADVDSDRLYEELELAEAEIRQQLYRKDAERMLDEMLRRLRIVEHLLNIAATPAELAEFRQHSERFRVEAFMDFIQSFNPEFAEIGADCLKLNAYLRQALEFYRVADLRSRQFVDNTLARMDQRGTRLAVLITGGYHSDHIQALLQQRGVSFLAVKPRLTKIDLVNPYFSLLRERKTPLEKLLAQNQNILALPTNYPSAALRNNLPETVTTYLNQADVTLKDAGLANEAADGKMTLAALQAAHAAQIAAYPENNPAIAIDWEQARANESRGVFLLPFKNLGFTALIRRATGENLVGALARMSVDDFDIALLDNQTALANEAAYLNPSRLAARLQGLKNLWARAAALLAGIPLALQRQTARVANLLAGLGRSVSRAGRGVLAGWRPGYQPLTLANAVASLAVSAGLLILAAGMPVVSLAITPVFLINTFQVLGVANKVIREHRVRFLAHLFDPVGTYDPATSRMVDPKTGLALAEAPWYVRAHEQYAHHWVQVAVDSLLRAVRQPSLAANAEKAGRGQVTAGYVVWNVIVSELLAHALDWVAAPLAMVESLGLPARVSLGFRIAAAAFVSTVMLALPAALMFSGMMAAVWAIPAIVAVAGLVSFLWFDLIFLGPLRSQFPQTVAGLRLGINHLVNEPNLTPTQRRALVKSIRDISGQVSQISAEDMGQILDLLAAGLAKAGEDDHLHDMLDIVYGSILLDHGDPETGNAAAMLLDDLGTFDRSDLKPRLYTILATHGKASLDNAQKKEFLRLAQMDYNVYIDYQSRRLITNGLELMTKTYGGKAPELVMWAEQRIEDLDQDFKDRKQREKEAREKGDRDEVAKLSILADDARIELEHFLNTLSNLADNAEFQGAFDAFLALDKVELSPYTRRFVEQAFERLIVAHTRDLAAFTGAGEKRVLDYWVEQLEPTISVANRVLLNRAFQVTAKEEDIAAVLKLAGTALNPRTGLLVLQRHAQTVRPRANGKIEPVLISVIENTDLSMDQRLYAFYQVASRWMATADQDRLHVLVALLNGKADDLHLHVARLMKDNARVGRMFKDKDTALRDEELKTYVAAVWADTLWNHPELPLDHFEKIAQTIAGAEIMDYYKNAAASFKIGGQLIDQAKDRPAEFLMLVLAHELMHNILNHSLGFKAEDTRSGIIHEFTADALAKAMAGRYGLTVEEYEQILKYQQNYEEAAKADFAGIEEHQGARAQDKIFQAGMSRRNLKLDYAGVLRAVFSVMAAKEVWGEPVDQLVSRFMESHFTEMTAGRAVAASATPGKGTSEAVRIMDPLAFEEMLDRFFGKLGGALLGAQAEGWLAEVMHRVVSGLGYQAKPGQAVLAAALELQQRLGTVIPALMQELQVEGVALESLGARAPPVREKLRQYLANLPDATRSKIGAVDAEMPVVVMKKLPADAATDTDLDRMGVFHFNGTLYLTEAVFQKLAAEQRDDGLAAILLHELLEEAGLSHDEAVLAVTAATEGKFPHDDLVHLAGLELDQDLENLKQDDYYSRLGLARDAGPDQIKAVFRRVAFKTHPDLHRGNPYAEENFRRLDEAYAILSDHAKRQTYDQWQAGRSGQTFEQYVTGSYQAWAQGRAASDGFDWGAWAQTTARGTAGSKQTVSATGAQKSSQQVWAEFIGARPDQIYERLYQIWAEQRRRQEAGTPVEQERKAAAYRAAWADVPDDVWKEAHGHGPYSPFTVLKFWRQARMDAITELLQKNGRISIADAAEALKLEPARAEKLLDVMVGEGKLLERRGKQVVTYSLGEVPAGVEPGVRVNGQFVTFKHIAEMITDGAALGLLTYLELTEGQREEVKDRLSGEGQRRLRVGLFMEQHFTESGAEHNAAEIAELAEMVSETRQRTGIKALELSQSTGGLESMIQAMLETAGQEGTSLYLVRDAQDRAVVSSMIDLAVEEHLITRPQADQIFRQTRTYQEFLDAENQRQQAERVIAAFHKVFPAEIAMPQEVAEAFAEGIAQGSLTLNHLVEKFKFDRHAWAAPRAYTVAEAREFSFKGALYPAMDTGDDRLVQTDQVLAGLAKFLKGLNPLKQIGVVDLGFGLVPVTTHRTAAALQSIDENIRVLGIELNMPHTLVADPATRVQAAFDREGNVLFLTSNKHNLNRRTEEAILKEWPELAQRLRAQREALLARAGEGQNFYQDEAGSVNPWLDPQYQAEGMRVQQGDLTQLNLTEKADLIRAANLDLHFSQEAWEQVRRRIGDNLREGGFYLEARTHMMGWGMIYAVYQKQGDTLVQLDAKQVARLGVGDQLPSAQVSSRALRYVDSLQTRMLKVVRELMDFYGPQLTSLSLLDELGQGDLRDLVGDERVRLGIPMKQLPDKAMLDRWRDDYGIEVRLVPNLPDAVKIDVRAFARQSGSILWGMLGKLITQLSQEKKSTMVLAAPDRGRLPEGPSLSIRNSLFTGLLLTGLAVFTGTFLAPLMIASIFGTQIGLMLAIRNRYNQAHPGEEKPLIDWLLREQVANIRHQGLVPDYLAHAGQFTRTWFRWHEAVERFLPFRRIPVVGNAMNHMAASLPDPFTGLAASLQWAWNVFHLYTTQGANVGLSVAKDYNGMSRQAADYLAGRIQQLIAERGRAVISVAAGSTPEGVYRLLAENAAQYAIDWSKVHFFHTEEYVGVAQNKAPSRHYILNQQLVAPLQIPAANFHFLNGMAANLEKEAARYEKEIAAMGGIDIQLLGIGRNGHIGGNEPNVSSFGSRTGNVRWMEESRQADARFFDNDINAVPKRALAMGMGTILEAREVILLASGAEKAVAVAKALQGPITWRLPASALRLHPLVNFFTDEAASKGLDPSLARGLRQEQAGRLARSIRLADIRAWQKEQANVFRAPLTLTTGVIVIGLLLFGAYPLLLAGILAAAFFFLPKNRQARNIFLHNLKQEFAWPSRVVTGTIIFFGLVLSGMSVAMLGVGMIGAGFAIVMGVIGLVYQGWGVYHFFKRKAIITLDGPDLEGKQDIAMALAENYGYTYVDVSMIYRALAAKALTLGLDPASPKTLESLARTKLQFDLDRQLGRQRVYMDNKEITQEILTAEGRLGFDKVMDMAKILGRMPAVESHVKERLLRMSAKNNLVVVGQNMGNLLDRQAKLKFYITGDLKARAEQLLKKRLAEEPTLEELATALKAIRKKELAERQSQIAPAKPQSDAIIIDSTRISPGDAIARAMGVVEERASAFFPIRAWWNRTYRPTHRMFERAEGEIIKRQLFESRGDLWVAKSDVDNLSALNQFYGKKIVNYILADINELRLEGINLPAVRRMTRGAISIRDGGDEATTVLDGKLLPAQVNMAMESMRRHVQDKLRSRYRILTLEGYQDTAGDRLSLEGIADAENAIDPKMLRVTHDPIYGTQLLLRVDLPDTDPEKQIAALAAKIRDAGLGTLKPLDLSTAVREVMGAEEYAKLKARDRDMLARGALWPCPTISIGASKSTRSLPADRAGVIQEKFLKKQLSRAELAEWMDSTDKLASDFLHEAKQHPGKNAAVVDPLVGELQVKKAEAGESSLDPKLKQRIDLERIIYEYNGLLKDERGKQMYDGLVPWALSSAGLRQYVMEALNALRGKSVFEPQIFIARAPPSVGPDKIQLVLVTPEHTSMIELEGRYWGGRFEDLAFETLRQQMTEENAKLPQEKQRNAEQLRDAIRDKFASYQLAYEDGHVLYKFSTLNNLVNYTTGDEMILAPHYFTNDLSLQARFLEKIRSGGLDDTFRLFVTATRHGRNLDAAVKGLVKTLEKSLNDSHNNLVKISPTAVWSSVPTAEAMKNGLGRLFQETTIAGLAHKERFEAYSDQMVADAQIVTTRRSAERLAKMLKESAALPETGEAAVAPLATPGESAPAFQGEAWRDQVQETAMKVATAGSLGLAIRLGLLFVRSHAFEGLLASLGLRVRPITASRLATAMNEAVDRIFGDPQKRALLAGTTAEQLKDMLRVAEKDSAAGRDLTPEQQRLEELIHGGLIFPVMEGKRAKYFLASPSRLDMLRRSYPDNFGEVLQYLLMHELVCLRDGHQAAIEKVDALHWPSGLKHARLASLAMNARLVHNSFMEAFYPRRTYSQRDMGTIASFLRRDHPMKEEAFQAVDRLDDDQVLAQADLALKGNNLGLAANYSEVLKRPLTLAELYMRPTAGFNDLTQLLFTNMSFLDASGLNTMGREQARAEQMRAMLRDHYTVIKALEIMSRRQSPLLTPESAADLADYLDKNVAAQAALRGVDVQTVAERLLDRLLTAVEANLPADESAQRITLLAFASVMESLRRNPAFQDAMQKPALVERVRGLRMPSTPETTSSREIGEINAILKKMEGVYPRRSELIDHFAALAGLALTTPEAQTYLVAQLDRVFIKSNGYQPAFMDFKDSLPLRHAAEMMIFELQPHTVTPARYLRTTPSTFDTMLAKWKPEGLTAAEQDEVGRFHRVLDAIPAALAAINQDPRYPMVCGPAAQAISRVLKEHGFGENQLMLFKFDRFSHIVVEVEVAGVRFYVDGTGNRAVDFDHVPIAPVVVPVAEVAADPELSKVYPVDAKQVTRSYYTLSELPENAAEIIQSVQQALISRRAQLLADSLGESGTGVRAPAMSVRNAAIAGAVWSVAVGLSGFWLAAGVVALLFGFQIALMVNLWRNYQADQPADRKESVLSWIWRTGGSVAASERGVFQEYHPYAGLLALHWFQMHETVERYLPFQRLPVLNHLLASLLDGVSGVAAAVLWGRNIAAGRNLLRFSRGVMPEARVRETLRSVEAILDSQRMKVDDLRTPQDIQRGWSDTMDVKAHRAGVQIRRLVAKLNQELQHLSANQRQEFWDQVALALLYRFDSNYTFVHSWRVGRLAEQMARIYGPVHGEAKRSDAEIQRYRRLGLVHDFGKLLLPKQLLYKGQRLTDQEAGLIRSHARMSGVLLEAFGFGEEATIAAGHHEFLNGKGYPFGLAGGQIRDEVRAMTVADSFDAAISNRPYRTPKEKMSVLKELWEDAISADPRYDRRWVAALWFAQRLPGTPSGPSTPGSRARIDQVFAEKDLRNRALRGERSAAERALTHLLKGVLFDVDAAQAGNAELRLPLSGSVSFLRTAFLAVTGAFLLWLTGAKVASPGAHVNETLGVLVQIQSDSTAEMFVRFGAGNFLHPGSVQPLSQLGWLQRLLNPLGKTVRGEDGLPVFYMPDRLLQGQPEFRLPLLKMMLEYRLRHFESQNRQDLLTLTLAQPGFFLRAIASIRMAVNPAGLLAGILKQDRSPVAQALLTDHSRAAAAFAAWSQAPNPQTALELANALLDAAARAPAETLPGSLATVAELSRRLPGFNGVVLGVWDPSAGARAGTQVVLPLALWRNPAKLERWLGRIRNLPVNDRHPILQRERPMHGMRNDA